MTTFRERLTVPLSWWIGCGVVGAACGWILLVSTTRWAALGGLLVGTAVAAVLVARFGSVTIVRDERGLRVGPAFLDAEHLGGAEALHRDAYRLRMTTEADARAYLVTRPYLDRGVLVRLDDPRDPTPYWLLSSRRPDELAAAINEGRPSSDRSDPEIPDSRSKESTRGQEA